MTSPFQSRCARGRFDFCLRHASVDAARALGPDTFEGEFRRSVENLREVLESAVSDLRHVVHTRNDVREPANVTRYNELYREYFSAPFPGRATITGCLPPVLHFEIECIAVPKRS